MSTTVTDTKNTVPQSLLTAMNGSASSGSSTQAAQDNFMKLLVTQLQNQDPLNPMDNAQMTSQLAQLSTVSGIDKLNTTVESLMSTFTAGQSLQAANMIGHGVLIAGNTVTVSGGHGLLGADLAAPASSVKIVIKDAGGNIVRQMDVGATDAGTQMFQWDGKTDAGATAADGQYTYSLTATGGGKAVTATSLAVDVVNSVSTGAQGVKLNVSNGTSVSMSDVRQIY
jgi:flagellar basal-body rod modification protein FlgD